MPNLVSGWQALASEFSISKQAAQRWGVPFIAKRNPQNVDCDAVYEWLIRNKPKSKGLTFYASKYGLNEMSKHRFDREEWQDDDKEESLGKQIQRQELRLRTAKADREEAARDKERERLIVSAHVADVYKMVGTEVRIALMSLPNALAEELSVIDDVTEVKKILSDAIRECLQSLSAK